MLLEKVLDELDDFLEVNKIFGTKFTFVTCGDFDLKSCLKKECNFMKISYPNYLKDYINIQNVYPKHLF